MKFKSGDIVQVEATEKQLAKLYIITGAKIVLNADGKIVEIDEKDQQYRVLFSFSHSGYWIPEKYLKPVV